MTKRAQKRAALKHTARALNIAERLYRRDRERYKPVFGWIGRQVKQRKDPELIQRAVERLAEREGDCPPSGAPRAGTVPVPAPVLDVVQYLGGTLRKLEQERDAASARRGEPTRVGEILGECYRRIKK